MTASIYIKRYILLNVYLGNWKPNFKLPSAHQFAIKFNTTISTAKKTLSSLQKGNILFTKKRQGYFVNPQLFLLVPLSIRKKYGLNFLKKEVIKTKDNFILKKVYSYSKNDVHDNIKVWVESKLNNQNLTANNFNIKKTFMANLASNGIIIFKIKSRYTTIFIKHKWYMLEERKLYDDQNILAVKEKIFIPVSMWFESKEIKI